MILYTVVLQLHGETVKDPMPETFATRFRALKLFKKWSEDYEDSSYDVFIVESVAVDSGIWE